MADELLALGRAASAQLDRIAERAPEVVVAYQKRLTERVQALMDGQRIALEPRDLIREAYRGIRPAPGYPACPDHTEKRALFELLDAPRAAQMELTENYAMRPAASVAGLYFAHPDSAYFQVGKLERDQITDYARRKGMPVAEVERWLRPNLAYET